MAIRRSHTTYAAVRTEGGLLPPDLLDRILSQDDSLGGLQSADYGLTTSTRLMAAMSEAWQAIQLHWASFNRTRDVIERGNGTGTTETRYWVQQVLRELGFHDLRFQAAAETVGDRSFLISHRAGEAGNAPPVHIATFRQDLDTQSARTGGGEKRSPQALVQGYLNATSHLWGVLTNGLTFRLLRENRQIDRVLRLEFDLEAMLEEEDFAEFQLFWLILHRSRFVHPGGQRETAWLERWSQTAASEGTRALGHLSKGVETAIESLGQGLLTHQDNLYLREQLQSGALTIESYYQELLRLVYRLLFLMVAEERHLLFKAGTASHVVERYKKHYSVERLRGEATRIRNREGHYDDLWLGLLVTFDALRFPKEANALGLEPLGGGLFGAGSCPHVADDAAPGTTGSGRIDGRPRLANAYLLAAVESLSEVTRNGITRRINYRDLDVEELGSVYEGLLEHQPALEPLANRTYRFSFAASGERKSTGSYYTPRSLVQELLNSALDPVIDQALARLRTPEDQKKALLALNVCDPACGSGHFLLGAARRIGRRLAEIDAGPGNEPDLADIRHGVRQAIRACVYGVDKNPLAIDLCKTALWIESHEPGAPISFLDHHIRHGDSLVGVFDREVLKKGIPDGAYTAVTGDDKKIASALKSRNRKERPTPTKIDGRATSSRMMGLEEEGLEDYLKDWASRLDEIEAMPDDTIEAVQKKERAYHQLHGRDDWLAITAACDLWTYAFFSPMTPEFSRHVPTSATVRRMIAIADVPGDIVGKAQAEAASVGFFHWPLQFPEVFHRGGFDTVLGNPPWEQVQLDPGEYFSTRRPEISNAPNMAAKNSLIKKLGDSLEQGDQVVYAAFMNARYQMDCFQKFIHESDRFPLTSIGRINTAPLFAELTRGLVTGSGLAGIIVPSGIATDSFTQKFFADIVNKASLAALYDFENRKKLFEAVDSRMKFSLMVLAGRSRQDARFRVGFFLLDPLEIHDPEKTFTLGADDIALLNPNTRTCPIFRSSRDAELTKDIYRRVPVLIDESKGDEGNPWGVKFGFIFQMNTSSHMFVTKEQLETLGARPAAGSKFFDGIREWWPLFEGKLFHQYDHRFASYDGFDDIKDVSVHLHQKSDFSPQPRYWVSKAETLKALRGQSGWSLGLRRFARNNDLRTSISAAVPLSGYGDNALIANDFAEPKMKIMVLANLNSIPFDYVVRQKLGGTNVNQFVLKQLPVLPPETYSNALLDKITPRVLELTYTAHDMDAFARDLDYDGPPFVWDEERRTQLRAELDGIYAHLYSISRDDFSYILDTFPIVERKDIAEFGEYRTKRLCLEAYDHFADHPAITAAKPMAGVV